MRVPARAGRDSRLTGVAGRKRVLCCSTRERLWELPPSVSAEGSLELADIARRKMALRRSTKGRF